jgi:SAM-dependent methyltransferase
MADNERDYLLGTHDEEIARLGLQHRVWRPRVLDAWRRAGITTGMTVADAGAGPGWATVDLAEIVGPTGRVHALERSQRFLHALTGTARARSLSQIQAHAVDLAADALPVGGLDAVWVRWVLAFIGEPGAVVAKLAAALKPGGVMVVHEYLDYATWSMAPANPEQAEFKDLVIRSWRESGGEPDVGRSLPTLMAASGLRICELRPIIDIISPANYVWEWPMSFVHSYLDRLVDEGMVEAAWAERIRGGFARAEADPATVMVTPLVLEVIAEKV